MPQSSPSSSSIPNTNHSRLHSTNLSTVNFHGNPNKMTFPISMVHGKRYPFHPVAHSSSQSGVSDEHDVVHPSPNIDRVNAFQTLANSSGRSSGDERKGSSSFAAHSSSQSDDSDGDDVVDSSSQSGHSVGEDVVHLSPSIDSVNFRQTSVNCSGCSGDEQNDSFSYAAHSSSQSGHSVGEDVVHSSPSIDSVNFRQTSVNSSACCSGDQRKGSFSFPGNSSSQLDGQDVVHSSASLSPVNAVQTSVNSFARCSDDQRKGSSSIAAHSSSQSDDSDEEHVSDGLINVGIDKSDAGPKNSIYPTVSAREQVVSPDGHSLMRFDRIECQNGICLSANMYSAKADKKFTNLGLGSNRVNEGFSSSARHSLNCLRDQSYIRRKQLTRLEIFEEIGIMITNILSDVQGTCDQRLWIADGYCHFDVLFEKLNKPTQSIFTYVQHNCRMYSYGVDMRYIIQPFSTPHHIIPANWTRYSEYLKHEVVYATCGIHPIFSDQYNLSMELNLRNVLMNKRVVGVGEIGLDFISFPHPPPSTQIKVFVNQLQIAKEMSLPVMIISRGSFLDTLESLLKVLKSGHLINWRNFEYGTGELAMLKSKFSNAYFSCSPYHLTNLRLQNIMKQYDLTKILPESISPHLQIPECEHVWETHPIFVLRVYKLLSDLFHVPLSEATTVLVNNFKLFYCLD